MNKDVRFSGAIKRSSQNAIARNRAYNEWKQDWLKYNQFQKIDFTDDQGREYKFHVKKHNSIPSEYNDPPTFLSDQFVMSKDRLPDDIQYFGKVAFSMRLPSRKEGNNDLKFPEPNGKVIYLYNVQTGAVCAGNVYQMFYSQRSKTGKIALKNFELIGKVNDDVQFRDVVKNIK
jgi:hypothetical protein